MSPLPPEIETSKDKLAQQSLQQPPLQEQGRQDLSAIEDCQEPEIETPIIPQSPPHVHGPEDLRPLHDGAGSPQPPEVGVCKQDGEGSPLPPEFEVGNPEGQLVLAPIPVEANRDAVCQDQLAQQTLLQVPIPLQVHRDADCQDQLVQQSLLNAPV